MIIDRGSRLPEVKEELDIICSQVKQKGGYDAISYCFLEVIPPFISEGVNTILKHDLDTLTIVPYFLYRGKKVKAAVSEVMKLQENTKAKFLVTKPMSMDPVLVNLVQHRISTALSENNISIPEKDVDVLIIGHGSKDINAKMAIQYVEDNLQPLYRNVRHCFLEIEEPNIQQGITACEKDSPKVLVVVFYFLHKGAHVQHDIYEDLNPALKNASVGNVLITKHIGTDEMIVDLIIRLAGEVEDASR